MRIENFQRNLSIPNQPHLMMPVIPGKSAVWLKPTDQMDAWLDSLGYYRKHIARDASSLFRCVSEQVFLTQVHHFSLRKQCIQFAINQPEIFKKLTNIPVKEYVDRLFNVREWGNSLDMEIMSLIYGLDFVMYKEIKCPEKHVTSNGFTPRIVLSLSYDHHYDTVYPKQHILNAAICQSIFYEILYKEVFKLEEVDYAVDRMLHDKSARYQPELNMALYTTGFQMRLEMRDACRNVKQLLNCGITPFPYKVAKSLDPNIYRNVEYDTWNEQRKGLRHGINVWNDRELQVGSRCVANFNENGTIVKRHGYIQEMTPNNGPVLIFVEEFGRKLTMPFENLEILPSNSNSKEGESDLDDSGIVNDIPENEDDSSIDENIQNLKRETDDKIYQMARNVPSGCNVHYAHPSSTSISSSCYSCVTAQMGQAEDETKLATTVDETAKMNEDTRFNEMTSSGRSSPISVPYPVPLYPVASQEMNVQPSTVSNVAYSKASTSDCTDVNSTVRFVYNNPIDSYYRYGYSSYPYYSCVIYPVNSDPAPQSNTDVSGLNYPPVYPVIPKQNELSWGFPSNHINLKKDTVYSSQMIHSQHVKRSMRNTHDTPEYLNAESAYRTKDVMYTKEAVPVNTPTRQNVMSNLYPITYPYSPHYYYPHTYYGTCSEIPPSYGNTTDIHPLPSLTPIMRTEEMYQANGQFFLQPLLPNPSQ